MEKYPMLMAPVFKDNLWGGVRLREEYGKLTDMTPLAESWELSCHRDGPCTIANGRYSGMRLADYYDADRAGVLGPDWDGADGFPLLVKLIDAKAPLSVQVHPNDAYAAAAENDHGKAEMWLVLEAEPGAELVYGVSRELTRGEFMSLIENDRLDEALNRVSVRRGDVFFVPPGTLHAIGAGILIAEVQQSSNATYRVWDYGRVGADGKPRQLHIQKTLDVARLSPTPVPPLPEGAETGPGWSRRTLAHCAYFTAALIELDGEKAFTGGFSGFFSLTLTDGNCSLDWDGGSLSLSKGATVFIPAGCPDFRIKGRARLLRAGK